MIRSKITVMTLAGVLSLGSWVAFAGNDAPIDKGGMPPSTEMNAGSGPENALPPGSIGGGNGADANGSSTSPKKDIGANSEKSAVQRRAESGDGEVGSTGKKGAVENHRY